MQIKKNAANNFEKQVFKLAINNVFGKTMENLRKRIDWLIMLKIIINV